MSVSGSIGLIDSTIARPSSQRPCQHRVTCSVIAGRGRVVAHSHHCHRPDEGDQTTRNGRFCEQTDQAPIGEWRQIHGAALQFFIAASTDASLTLARGNTARKSVKEWTRMQNTGPIL